MGANADISTQPKPPIKRHMRNYLLDPRFQLKYTGMVVGVSIVIASVLGYFAYDYSKGQTEALTIQMAMQPDLDPEVASDLEGFARALDQKVLASIIGGIVILALALGFTGIIVTHKLVGPAYKMRRLLREVAEGKLKVAGGLRKGDELQELFEAFADMVQSLRDAQAKEVAALDAALTAAREHGIEDEALASVVVLADFPEAYEGVHLMDLAADGL